MHQKGLGTKLVVNPQFVHWELMTTQEEFVGIRKKLHMEVWWSLWLDGCSEEGSVGKFINCNLISCYQEMSSTTAF